MANSRAIGAQEQVRVRIDRTKGRYLVEHQVGPVGGKRHFEPLTESSAFSGTLDAKVSVTLQTGGVGSTSVGMSNPSKSRDAYRSGPRNPFAPDTTVRFFPDGTCDEAVLNLRDLSGHLMTLHLNPVTARMVVQEKP